MQENASLKFNVPEVFWDKSLQTQAKGLMCAVPCGREKERFTEVASCSLL
jgi:hypothetical protein